VDAQNKRLWEEAYVDVVFRIFMFEDLTLDNRNSKEFRPMPAVIISRGASASNTPSSLPLNQPPTMRILKRPSPSASPSQSSTNVNGSESLQDREARYQAARERIFGPSSPSAGSNDKMPKVSSPTPPPLEATKIVREPRGPDSSGDNGTGQRHDGKGFRERKIKPPPPSSASSPLVQPGPS